MLGGCYLRPPSRVVDLATVVATSVIAYPEACSAFARVGREGGLTALDLSQRVEFSAFDERLNAAALAALS